MSSDVLYSKVSTDSLSSTNCLPYSTSVLKFCSLIKNNSLFSKLIGENLFREQAKEQEDTFVQYFSSPIFKFKQNKTVKLI